MASQTTSDKVLVGIIGGSGMYHLDNLKVIEKIHPDTPWGKTSSPITIALAPCGVRVAFLARHGETHNISPSAVPACANIAALKSLGVRLIVAFSAVGSLREEIAPGDFVLPAQIIDRTKGVRQSSFFDGTGVVAHAGFGEPFSKKLGAFLEGRVREALERVHSEKTRGEGEGEGAGGGATKKSTQHQKKAQVHADKTVVCMEGPQFSTRAESRMYRAWGGDIINMSVLPEAKLAREAELSYALICTATDYDAWRAHETPVTAAAVFATLQANAATSRKIAEEIVADLHVAAESGEILSEEAGCMADSIVPPRGKLAEDGERKLKFVLPNYFDKEHN